MTNIITIEELKNSVFNANVDDEYIQPALTEAQSIYLREILGDSLLNAVINKINDGTLAGHYQILVNDYIKPYLTYVVQSLIVVPINFKIRNAGIVSQFDNGFSTSTMKDTQYLKDYYDNKAQFYGNRMTEYLMKNSDYIKEYSVSAQNITNPRTSQTVTNIYLGGTGKSTCGAKTSGGGGGTADAVEWENILNKPQPTIGAGIVTIKQGDTTQEFGVNDTEDTIIELSDGVTDYEELENKPDLSVFALKADTYTKTEIDATTSQINQQIGTKANQTDFTAHTGNSTIHITAQERENWNGKSDADNVYTKSEIDSKVSTINQEIGTKANQTSLDTHTGNDTIHVTAADKENWNGKTTMAAVEAKGYAVANDLATVATSGSYNDLTNKPNLATVATSGSYNDLSDKPVMPTVPTNVSAFTNDAGYLTQHQSLQGYATEQWVENKGYSTFSGSYNDLADKPTIPTVNNAVLTVKQGGVTKGTFSANANENVEINLEAGGSGSTDWNDIANKPDFATVATSGSYNDLTDKPEIPGQVNADWNASSGVQQILNKPDLDDYVRVTDYEVDKQSIANALADKVETDNLCRINNERLDTNTNFELVRTDSIATLTITQGGTRKGTFTPDSGSDVTINLDAGGSGSTDWSDITNKPNFAAVATSGSYNDLSNTPNLATVATSGSYNDLSNKPTIPTVNDGSLTIQKNGTAIATFTANDDTNKTANITVPTDETDLGLTTETWTFTLQDSSTVTKQVVIKPTV